MKENPMNGPTKTFTIYPSGYLSWTTEVPRMHEDRQVAGIHR